MAKLRVKEIAQQKGLTMGKLSRAADVDMSTLSRVYNDSDYSPTLLTLEKLAKALHVKIADLIEEEPYDEG
jgi:transcriptional regulator with XRE-family HTH domain